MPEADLAIIARFKDQASSGLSGFQGSAMGVVGGLTKMAAVATGIGIGALGALGGASLKVAAEFETTISSIKAVSGATAAEMKSVQGLALQLGKDTSFSAKEAAAGIEELIKGGVAIPDVLNGAAKSMLDLAAAGGVSLPEAAEIASNALAMFNLKGADMAHVSDLIAGAANASSLSVSDFKFSLSAVGAVASQSGQSFDDLAQAIAIMGKSGIKGSDAGTSLKTMLMNLQPTTKGAKKAFAELGIVTKEGVNQFINANGSFKSMAEIAGVLQKATAKLTDAQKMQYLETMFGSDAIRAAAIMAKEGAAGFNEMAGAMGKVTAASVGAEKLNNLQGSIEQLKGSLETAGITLGLALTPMAKGATDALTGMVNAAIPWIEKYSPAMVAGIERLASIGKGAATSLMSIFNLAKTGDFKGGIFGLTEDSPVIVGLLAMRNILQSIVGVVRDLTGDLARGGIGVVIDDIQEMTGIDLSGIVKALKQVIDILTVGFKRAGDAFQRIISGDIVGGIMDLFSIVTNTRSRLIETLAGWARAFVEWVGPMIPGLMRELGRMAEQIFHFALAQIPLIAAQFGRWADAAIDWAITILPPTLRYLGEMATGILKWIEQQVPKLIDTFLGEWLPAALKWVEEAARRVIPQLGNLLSGILDWLNANAPTLAEKFLGEWLPAALVWIVRAAIDIIPKLAELIWVIGEWLIREGVPKLIELGARMGIAILRGLAQGLGNLGGAIFNGGEAAGPGAGIPGFAQGGVVPGPIGAPMLATVHGGEAIIPVGGRSAGTSSVNVFVTVYGSVTAERDLAESIRKQLIRVGQRNVNIFGGYA